MQAWGLLELQAGNMWAALALLERASRTDARCAPVSRLTDMMLDQPSLQPVHGIGTLHGSLPA